jgi:hypothetical protein
MRVASIVDIEHVQFSSWDQNQVYNTIETRDIKLEKTRRALADIVCWVPS